MLHARRFRDKTKKGTDYGHAMIPITLLAVADLSLKSWVRDEFFAEKNLRVYRLCYGTELFFCARVKKKGLGACVNAGGVSES